VAFPSPKNLSDFSTLPQGEVGKVICDCTGNKGGPFHASRKSGNAQLQAIKMNVTELAERLKRESYNQFWYSFDRDVPPLEGYILELVDARWTVFYFERGATRDLANFESEIDACDFLYQRMKEAFGSAAGRARH
jgi:hypothetical protein